jgi:hypothetical protein
LQQRAGSTLFQRFLDALDRVDLASSEICCVLSRQLLMLVAISRTATPDDW